MKLQLKGRRFDRMEEIQQELQNVLAGIAEFSWYASRTGLPARVLAVATALGSMCPCTRGLF